MCRLFNIIQLSNDTTSIYCPISPCIIASLDAEKAIDKVSWPFLFASLKKFGCGEYYSNWIKLLYRSPTASVVTNGFISKPFNLLQGTRQGFPLSLLLFTLYIEPLAASSRQNQIIMGLQTKSYHHKISLYADDILLFISNPSSSLPAIHNIINAYSKLSGYSINWSKSEILPLSGYKWDSRNCQPPIKKTAHSIKYLGIPINSNINDLFKLNFIPLLKTIKGDLERWNNLPVSLMGRISSIKMNILPKFNYLFSMTPVFPPSSWFSSLNRIVNTFYWKGRKPRIKFTGSNIDTIPHY